MPVPAAGAMLSFQQTMQAFLQTQQEVMTAYLDGSAQAVTEASSEALERLVEQSGAASFPMPMTAWARRIGAGRSSQPLRTSRALASRRVPSRAPGAERFAGSYPARSSRPSSF